MITFLAILALAYVGAGIITVAVYSSYCWTPRSWGEVGLQFAVWPFLAVVMALYVFGGGK